MNTYYRILFSVELFHGFYRDGRCRALRVEPTSETGQLLRGLRLFARQKTNGLAVIGEFENRGSGAVPDLQPRVPVPADTTFTFKLLAEDPAFLNLTQVDQSTIEPGSGFVFTNSAGAPESTDGTVRTVRVHDGPLGGPMALVGRVFSQPLETPPPAVVEVLDAAGLPVSTRILRGEMGVTTIDMNGFPEAVYEIRLRSSDGVLVSSRQVFVSGDHLPRPTGYLQVRYSPDILADAESRHAFTLNFHPRRIHWIYRVNVEEIEPGHPDNLDPNLLALQNAPAVFSKTVVAIVPKSVIFASQTRIQLREEPYRGIRLLDGAGPGVAILVSQMPNPLVSGLSRDGAAELESRMYLTLK